MWGRGASVEERNLFSLPLDGPLLEVVEPSLVVWAGVKVLSVVRFVRLAVQGYLAHKKTPVPRTLQ